MQRVGGIRVGPRLRPHPLDGLRVEPPEVGRARRVEPAPPRYRPRAALLERGVVEERVRLGVQDLVRKGRGLRQVARVHRDLAPLDALEEGHETVDVHRFVQGVVDGLVHEGVVRDLPLSPSEVLGARDLVGKHHRDEVLGLHPLDRGRHLAPARRRGTASETFAFQRQRMLKIGASSSAWTSTSRAVVLARYPGTSSSAKLWVSPRERTMLSSVAAAWSSKLNRRQKRLRSASPNARLIRPPSGEWMTSCMPPDSSKNRSMTRRSAAGIAPRAACPAAR